MTKKVFSIILVVVAIMIIFTSCSAAVATRPQPAEGATTYECFWKITFPMVSPMFLPILVYSIVDTFASSDLMQFMTVNSEGSKIAYGMSSTIAVIYFLVILLILFI